MGTLFFIEPRNPHGQQPMRVHGAIYPHHTDFLAAPWQNSLPRSSPSCARCCGLGCQKIILVPRCLWSHYPTVTERLSCIWGLSQGLDTGGNRLVLMTILYEKSSSRTYLPCAMEKSTLSPVSHKHDVVPAPKADRAVKYLWGSRAGGLSWEGKAAHMWENYIFTCCLSDVCLPENKYTSRLETNWSCLCTLHP